MHIHLRPRVLCSTTILLAMLLVTSCLPDNPSNALQELDRYEQSPSPGTKLTLKIKPAELTGDEALMLSAKLAARLVSSEIVQVLKFSSDYRKGRHQAAIAALERVNEAVANEIVGLMRKRLAIETQAEALDSREETDLRRDVENMTECEFAVATGQFVPMTGSDFCRLYDSGILDLLPLPATKATRVARLLAGQTTAKLPRVGLRKIPRAAATLDRYSALRQAVTQELGAILKRENFLVGQLLNSQWSVTL